MINIITIQNDICLEIELVLITINYIHYRTQSNGFRRRFDCGFSVWSGGRPPWDLPTLLLSFGPDLPLDIWLLNDAADLNQFVNSITKLKEMIATPSMSLQLETEIFLIR